MQKISAPVVIVVVIIALAAVFISFRNNFMPSEKVATGPPSAAAGVNSNKGK